MSDNLVKIIFSFRSDMIDKWMVETLWAETVDQDKGLYRIDDIPFYVTGIAWADVVFAEFVEEQLGLTFQHVVESSGRSTLQIMMAGDTPDKEVVREQLRGQGIDSEGFDQRFFVADIPKEVAYVPVKQFLDELEQKGVLFYAESCLSEVHRVTGS